MSNFDKNEHYTQVCKFTRATLKLKKMFYTKLLLFGTTSIFPVSVAKRIA